MKYYKNAVNKVASNLDLPPEVVTKVYKAYWKFIRDKIQELPLKEDISREEFSKLRTNFNIPSLGKLSCTYERMRAIKERYNLIRNLKEKYD